MAWCGICEEHVETSADNVMDAIEEFMEHCRVLHPETFDEIGRWPDGKPVIVDHTLEAEDFQG